MFANRLAKIARHLRKWPTKRGITCYRLYDRDIPEIPLAVDRYENCLHIAEYDRPHDRTAAQHGQWLEMLAGTAAAALEIPRADVFLKRRARQRGTSQYEKLDSLGRVITVREGGLKFKVNLSDYLDTGLFLDHRITRGLVREAAGGRRVLNLFAYTGSFSVYAAAGGARSVTTVDTSNTYLDWARANLASNGYSGEQFQFVRDDASAFLKFHKQGPCYDLAIVDPPTFSNSTRTEKDFEIQRDHVELLNSLMKIMSRGAPIFFSTNFRRFRLDTDAIRSNDIREISRQTIPPDFRNKRIHRCWLIVR
ncbi:MAG: SAM-dependent methyltransferase [Planctomycetota bacterium]|nr:MAG: SAM-dependent methyltransferase [Planctomycetota bacterium]